jgi:hypothetical protein
MTTFKKGDKVINIHSGDQGTVLIPNPAGMRDCVVVVFPDSDGVVRSMDGYTIPKNCLRHSVPLEARRDDDHSKHF